MLFLSLAQEEAKLKALLRELSAKCGHAARYCPRDVRAAACTLSNNVALTGLVAGLRFWRRPALDSGQLRNAAY
jgi:hypothetical protein